jgi:hypothetical protein
MEFPLAITVLAGILLYGAVFCFVGLRRGALAADAGEEEAPVIESAPQKIVKKNPQSIDGRMTRRAEYATDHRFGGNKVITLPFGNDEQEAAREANNSQ